MGISNSVVKLSIVFRLFNFWHSRSQVCKLIAGLIVFIFAMSRPALSAADETTVIHVDFGAQWELHNQGLWTTGMHPCDGLQLLTCASAGNKLHSAGLIWGDAFEFATGDATLPKSIMPFSYELLRRGAATDLTNDYDDYPIYDEEAYLGIDYNGDRTIDEKDVREAMDDILQRVRSMYEPFNVEVLETSSKTLDEVASILSDSNTNDAYIFVGGVYGGASGKASFDWNNEHSNIGFAFAGNFIGQPWNTNGIEEISIEGIADTIAHEAGHTFGLHHIGFYGDGAHEGEIMSHFNFDGSEFLRYPIPWAQTTLDSVDTHAAFYQQFKSDYELAQGVPFSETRQNSYEVLKEVLGLRVDKPAYVTGTGLHDRVTIGSSRLGTTAVVETYEDAAHTQHVETYSYQISTTNGVLVKAGLRDDKVLIDNMGGSFTSELLGGPGNDELHGGDGPYQYLQGGGKGSVLQGGTGNDLLKAGTGNDRIVFEGYTYRVRADGLPNPESVLGSDVISDSGGVDTLDFSEFPEPVAIDLSTSNTQTVDPVFNEISNPGILPVQDNDEIDLDDLEQDYCGQACGRIRLQLTIQQNRGSSEFENIIGSIYNDYLTGNQDDNVLEGREGNDSIEGNGGTDVLNGGLGNNSCSNLGIDVFCDQIAIPDK